MPPELDPVPGATRFTFEARPDHSAVARGFDPRRGLLLVETNREGDGHARSERTLRLVDLSGSWPPATLGERESPAPLGLAPGPDGRWLGFVRADPDNPHDYQPCVWSADFDEARRGTLVDDAGNRFSSIHGGWFGDDAVAFGARDDLSVLFHLEGSRWRPLAGLPFVEGALPASALATTGAGDAVLLWDGRGYERSEDRGLTMSFRARVRPIPYARRTAPGREDSYFVPTGAGLAESRRGAAPALRHLDEYGEMRPDPFDFVPRLVGRFDSASPGPDDSVLAGLVPVEGREPAAVLYWPERLEKLELRAELFGLAEAAGISWLRWVPTLDSLVAKAWTPSHSHHLIRVPRELLSDRERAGCEAPVEITEAE